MEPDGDEPQPEEVLATAAVRAVKAVVSGSSAGAESNGYLSVLQQRGANAALVFAAEEAQNPERRVRSFKRNVRTVESVQTSRRAARLRVSFRTLQGTSEKAQEKALVFDFESVSARDSLCTALTAARARQAGIDTGPTSAVPVAISEDGRSAAAPGVPALTAAEARRGAALAAQPALKRLYDDLVLRRGWISEEDFWGERREVWAQDAGLQQAGPRNAHFQHELKQLSQAGARGGDTYQLNAAIVRDIFTEYPEVAELHRKHVIGSAVPKLSEKEFWKQFLLSGYFRLRGKQKEGRHAAPSIFEEALQRQHEQERAADGDRGERDAALVLGDDLEDGLLADGYGRRRVDGLLGASHIADSTAKASEGEQVMRQVTKHSTRVLTACGAADATQAQAAIGGLDDLAARDSAAAQRKGSAAPPLPPSAPPSKRRRTDAVSTQPEAATVRRWPGAGGAPAAASLLPRGADRVAAVLAACTSKPAEGVAAPLPAHVADELSYVAASVTEVLRVFWKHVARRDGISDTAQVESIATHIVDLQSEYEAALERHKGVAEAQWLQLLEPIGTAVAVWGKYRGASSAGGWRTLQ
eukprot:TRINITY_DN16550_c0_g1_i1.p1 TRINITY_DN16550_c0_g1~~TRINITY_DN16550_c0_g1_i1.p1  ORF type:complete len:601 (+),score=166.81 TRINITY_DN16550_c0_g1_i1:50-1804(+)